MAVNNEDRLGAVTTAVTITYFSLYTIMMIIIGTKVYFEGQYSSKKSYFKYVWQQRSIWSSLLVHFYDTATDIGVLLTWYILMKEEEKRGVDYDHIDMRVFFYGGLFFVLLYRFVTIGYMAWNVINGDHDHEWWEFVLALFDMYILCAVYESFGDAQKVIEQNEKTLAEAIENAEKQTANTEKQTVDINKLKKDAELGDCEPSENQQKAQLIESASESMPQIILQSVFLIQSFDSELAQKSNVTLILLSLCASLISVTTKFGFADQDDVSDNAWSVDLSKKCPFINPLYVIRVLWRLSTVTVRFVGMSLLWAVVGGLYLLIYVGISILMWTNIRLIGKEALNHNKYSSNCSELGLISISHSIAFGMVCIVGNVITRLWRVQITKWIENLGLLIVTTVFAISHLDRFGDTDEFEKFRLFERNAYGNVYIFVFVISGWVAWVMDIALYLFMWKKNIIYGDQLPGFDDCNSNKPSLCKLIFS